MPSYDISGLFMVKSKAAALPFIARVCEITAPVQHRRRPGGDQTIIYRGNKTNTRQQHQNAMSSCTDDRVSSPPASTHHAPVYIRTTLFNRYSSTLSPVVGPRAELYRTQLVVEREVSYIDVARRHEDATWFPVNSARVADQHAHFPEVGCQLVCSECATFKNIKCSLRRNR